MKNLKKLLEQRSAKLAQMKSLTDALETKNDDGTIETRAFTSEEQAQFDALRDETERLTATISSITESRSLDSEAPAGGAADTDEQAELRAFTDYLATGAIPETRSDSNWTKSANGAVVPASIARKIIEKIKEISPIYSLATHYPVGGTLTIPYYDESAGTVTMAYADEFTDLTSTSGKLSGITLTGFLAGALCKVSKSLLNNSEFDILSYVVGKVAEAAVLFIDNELINGTSGKITGLTGITQTVTAASKTAVTADELIDLQDTVPDAYQANSVWVMSKKTRSAIRKLKDGDGNYSKRQNFLSFTICRYARSSRSERMREAF